MRRQTRKGLYLYYCEMTMTAREVASSITSICPGWWRYRGPEAVLAFQRLSLYYIAPRYCATARLCRSWVS